VKKLTIIAMVMLLMGTGVQADYQAGVELLRQGNVKAALGEFEMDIEIYGSYWYFPAYMAAVCYFQLKDYDAALMRLREAETATEQSETKVLDIAKIKVLEAQILVGQGKYNDAMSMADKYIPQAPADLQAKFYYVKGFAANKSGQHSKAVNDLIKATALDENDAAAYYQLGLAYVKNNNYDSAIKNLEKSLTLNPQNKVGFELLTDVCMNRARELRGSDKNALYQKTTDWCEKGLKQFRNDKALKINLGNAHLGAKEYSSAISVFENLSNSNGNDKDVLFGLGSAFLGNKQFAEALPILQRVKNRMSNEPVIYTYIGTAQMALANAESSQQAKLAKMREAIATLEEGRRKHSSNSGIRSKLAEANQIAATLDKNIQIDQQNLETDLANKRKLRELIAELRVRIREAEEVKRKQGIYPGGYERDKKQLADTIAEYEKNYGPLK